MGFKSRSEFKYLNLLDYHENPQKIQDLKTQKNIMGWVIEVHLFAYLENKFEETIVEFWKRICLELHAACFDDKYSKLIIDFID